MNKIRSLGLVSSNTIYFALMPGQKNGYVRHGKPIQSHAYASGEGAVNRACPQGQIHGGKVHLRPGVAAMRRGPMGGSVEGGGCGRGLGCEHAHGRASQAAFRRRRIVGGARAQAAPQAEGGGF